MICMYVPTTTVQYKHVCTDIIYIRNRHYWRHRYVMLIGGAPGACETLIDNKGARVLDYDEKGNFSIKTFFYLKNK